MDELPAKLLEEVCKNVRDLEDLVHLSQVNSWYRKVLCNPERDEKVWKDLFLFEYELYNDDYGNGDRNTRAKQLCKDFVYDISDALLDESDAEDEIDREFIKKENQAFMERLKRKPPYQKFLYLNKLTWREKSLQFLREENELVGLASMKVSETNPPISLQDIRQFEKDNEVLVPRVLRNGGILREGHHCLIPLPEWNRQTNPVEDAQLYVEGKLPEKQLTQQYGIQGANVFIRKNKVEDWRKTFKFYKRVGKPVEFHYFYGDSSKTEEVFSFWEVTDISCQGQFLKTHFMGYRCYYKGERYTMHSLLRDIIEY